MAEQERWEESVLGDSIVIGGSSPTRRKQSAIHLLAVLIEVAGVGADTGSSDGVGGLGGVA